MKKTFCCLFFGLLLSSSFCFAQETVTITTYYPSPYGVYNVLRLYPLITAPASCSEGELYFDSISHSLLYCNNVGAWQPLGGGFWTRSGTNLYTNDSGITDDWRVGIGTQTPAFKLSLNNDGGIIADGTYNSGAQVGTPGAGTRLLWYPRKAAFRAGRVTGDYWNETNIGNYSVAAGFDTKASGAFSVAMGDNTIALGAYSVAMGTQSTATGNSTFALGSNAMANAQNSVAIGHHVDTNGDQSVAIGTNVGTGANGDWAVVVGRGTDTGTYLTNDTANSLMIGFNSNVPTLFVGPASGASTTGNVGVGTSAPGSYKLAVNGTAAKPGGGSWSTFSDKRLKDIIGGFNYGLNEILKIHPAYYRYKRHNPLGVTYEKEFVGIAAQDIQKIIPEAVKEDRGYLMTDNEPIFWAMVNAIKELNIENDTLKQRITTLEAEVK